MLISGHILNTSITFREIAATCYKLCGLHWTFYSILAINGKIESLGFFPGDQKRNYLMNYYKNS